MTQSTDTSCEGKSIRGNLLALRLFDFRQRVHLHGVQAFVPTTLLQVSEHVGVPLEILLDFRCESRAYERLVPQTDAEIHYDRHNRLRLHGQLGDENATTGSASELMKHQTVSIDCTEILVT